MCNVRVSESARETGECTVREGGEIGAPGGGRGGEGTSTRVSC